MSDKLKANFFLNSAYQFLVICLPFILTPYLSRIFGADGVGEYSYYLTIVGYFGLFVLLGLNNYGNREVAIVKDNKEKLSETFCNIYALQIFCGFCVITIYSICNVFQSGNTLYRIFAIYLISYVFDINWFFFGLEEFKLTVIRNTIIKIATTILIFCFVKGKKDLPVYALLSSLSVLVTQISIWPFLKKHINYVKPTFKVFVSHIRPNLILFIPILGISFYNMMDKIMIGWISTNTEVGLYESADKIKNIPILFVTALGTVALPRASYLCSHKEEDSMIALFQKSIKIVIFITSSVCLGIMGIASAFVPFFFGEGFEKVTLILYVLLPSCFFIGVENVIKTQFLIPKKKEVIYIKSIFLGALINFILNMVLIPKQGAFGAAIATLSTEIVVCAYQIIKVGFEIKILKYIIKYSYLIIAGILMLFWLLFLNIPIENQVFELIYKVLLGIFTYFVALAVIKFKAVYIFVRRKLSERKRH